MQIVIVTLLVLVSAFLFYASYCIASGVYVKALCKAKRNDKVVALTFDDGPHPEQTSKVLDVLKEYDAKACFFCIGRNAEGNKELMNRIIDEGHLIGNHSYSHLFSFPLHSAKWMEQDMKTCQNILKNITHKEIKLFRPPFGVTNPMISKAIKRLNYTTIGWSIRSLDTCKSAEKVLNKIRKNLHPGAVILLHDTLPHSDELLRQILDLLRQNDYKIVGLNTLFDLKNDKQLKRLYILLLVLCATQLHAQMKPITDVDALKKKIEIVATTVKSIECDFTQVKHLDIFDEDITSKGRFYYRAEDKISLVYTKPSAYEIVINGEKIKTVSDGKKTIVNLKSNKVMKEMRVMLASCMSGNLSDVKGYDMTYYEDAQYYLVKVKPTNKGVTDYIAGFDIYMDKKDMSVAKLRISESTDNYTDYLFSNKRFNTLNDDAKFSVR